MKEERKGNKKFDFLFFFSFFFNKKHLKTGGIFL
nr:MAG TPA: hypothetical protein [Caudoviricetes sp.]